MSAQRTFQGIYGVQMICSPNGLRTVSVRQLSCSHNSHSCIRLWLLSALGYLFYKLSYGQIFLWFLGDVCGAGIQSRIAENPLRAGYRLSVKANANKFHHLEGAAR